MEVPDLSPQEVATILYTALQVIGTLEAACVPDQPFSAPLPRGMLSCGEAVTLVPALVVLIAKHYPHLMEPDGFMDAIRTAWTMAAGGEPN